MCSHILYESNTGEKIISKNEKRNTTTSTRKSFTSFHEYMTCPSCLLRELRDLFIDKSLDNCLIQWTELQASLCATVHGFRDEGYDYLIVIDQFAPHATQEVSIDLQLLESIFAKSAHTDTLFECFECNLDDFNENL